MLKSDSVIYCAWPKKRCYKYVRVVSAGGNYYVTGHRLFYKAKSDKQVSGWICLPTKETQTKAWSGAAAHGKNNPTLSSYTAAVDYIVSNSSPKGYLCHPGMSSLLPPRCRVENGVPVYWYFSVPTKLGILSRTGKPVPIKTVQITANRTSEEAYLIALEQQQGIFDQLGELMVKEGKAVSIDDSRIIWV